MAGHHVIPGLKDGADVQGRIDQLHAVEKADSEGQHDVTGGGSMSECADQCANESARE